MKETDQLKKLMETISKTRVGDVDRMTGEIERMPDDIISFDWKASPEDVIQTLNNALEATGVQFKIYDDGSDQVHVAMIRVDY